MSDTSASAASTAVPGLSGERALAPLLLYQLGHAGSTLLTCAEDYWFLQPSDSEDREDLELPERLTVAHAEVLANCQSVMEYLKSKNLVRTIGTDADAVIAELRERWRSSEHLTLIEEANGDVPVSPSRWEGITPLNWPSLQAFKSALDGLAAALPRPLASCFAAGRLFAQVAVLHLNDVSQDESRGPSHPVTELRQQLMQLGTNVPELGKLQADLPDVFPASPGTNLAEACREFAKEAHPQILKQLASVRSDQFSFDVASLLTGPGGDGADPPAGVTDPYLDTPALTIQGILRLCKKVESPGNSTLREHISTHGILPVKGLYTRRDILSLCEFRLASAQSRGGTSEGYELIKNAIEAGRPGANAT